MNMMFMFICTVTQGGSSMFKKVAFALLLGMLFSVAASAQTGDVYWVNYFFNNTTASLNTLIATRVVESEQTHAR